MTTPDSGPDVTPEPLSGEPTASPDVEAHSHANDGSTPTPSTEANVPAENENFPQPPDEDKGNRTHPLTGLVLGLVWGVGVAIAFGFGSVRDGDWLVALLSVPVGFVAGVGAGYLRWWFTRYFINETEIRIETGPIFRNSRRIPFARLQSIDINQPLVARIFRLSEVTIEMAGGSESSSKLRFVPLAEAREIRATVLQRSRALSSPRSTPAVVESPDASVSIPNMPISHDVEPTVHFETGHFEDVPTIITRVSPDRLLLGALLSLDLMFMLLTGIGIVIFFIVFDVPFAAMAAILPFVFALFQMVSSRVFRQWDFTLSQTEHGLRITRGLFDRSSQTIPFDRIQGIELIKPLLWRKLGWVKLEIDVAGYGIVSTDDGVSATTLLPISEIPLAQALMADLVPDPYPERHDDAINRASQRGRVFAPIGWTHRSLSRTADTVRTHTGWVTKRVQVIPQAKVQSVAIDQGPWQRRLRVATVSIHTPDGPVSIELRHMNAELAAGLLNAEIEQSRHAVPRPVSLQIATASPLSAVPPSAPPSTTPHVTPPAQHEATDQADQASPTGEPSATTDI